MKKLYRAIGFLTLGWLVGSCHDVVGPPPPPTVASVTFSPDAATLVPAATFQLSATARSGSGQTLERNFSWSTSDAAKATVSTSGLVTGVAPGAATITAVADGKSATAAITVLDGGVVSSSGGTLHVGSGVVQLIVPADAVASKINLWVAASSVSADDARVVKGTHFEFGPTGMTFAKPVVLKIKYDPANLPSGTEEAALELYQYTSSGWEVVPGSTSDVAAKVVSAQLSHLSAYAMLTPEPVSRLTISSPRIVNGALSLVDGESEQLTATVFSGNGRILIHRVPTWSSSDASVVSISATGLVEALKPGSATITASSGGSSASVVITVTPVPVASVTVALAPTSITAVETAQATATILDANGVVLTGRAITWSSDNTGVATVSQTGLVTAVSAGSANITATSESQSGSALLTVTSAPVATVTLSAATTPMLVGETQQLSAVTRDANGNVLTGRQITWSSSNSAVLTVSAAGLVTAAGEGTATITGMSESVSATTPVITVNPAPPPPVTTVTVSPASASIIVGATQQLVATLKDANNNILTGRTIGWVSGDPAVATVDPTTGLVTAVGPGGPVAITATSEGQTGMSSITVEPAPVATVTVGLAPVSITAVETAQATATTRDSNGGVLTGREVTWSSDNTAVATVSPQGIVTAIAVGTAGITATSEGKSGSATITVTQAPVATVIVSLAANSINAVETTQATATLRDSKNRILEGRSITWSSDNTGVATVSQTGLVTAVMAGSANITATSESQSGSASLTVTPAPVATVTLSTATTPMVVGEAQQLTALPKDAGGALLSGRTVTWLSSDPAVLSVSASSSVSTASGATMVVTALGAGTATITATSETAPSASTPPITVNPAPVATVIVSPASASIVVGSTLQLTATLQDAHDNFLTDRTIIWVSGNPAVATVNAATGLVTAVSAGGPVTITATSEGKSGTSSITVDPAPVATVTLSTATTPMAVGAIQQLTAVTRDANGNVLTGRTITWESSNTAVLTVSTNGLVTAAGQGTATITATSESVSATTPVITVNPATALTLRANPFIASGLTAPVFLTQPLNDGRIFVVEQPGRIRVVLNGVLQATPFLDISSKLIYNGERGLLSMAFHPQYASNHYFYVYFTGLSGEIRIERFTTTSDPSVADPASEKLIFTTPHAAADNHNGGLVAFGPDGMLYAAIGDGGGAGDLNGNAQNFNLYLGGMIRIDIDHGDPYSVPVDNPFVGQANKKPELWAKGLRNPWRYAFDPPTGLLFIADVGQSQHEEIDVVAATQGGLNYGWAIMEGFSCYNATTCNQTGLQLPLIDYPTHVAGTCSVTGGYVYRGSAMPTVQGHYFYSDYCAGWVRSLRYQNGVAVDQKDWGIKLTQVTSFGEDIAGELYLTSGNSIYKLVPGN